MKNYAVALALIALGTLAACGGGGGGGSSTPPVTATPSPGPGSAVFSISDPYSTQSTIRRPRYFSHATSAILITTNGTSVQLNLSVNSPNCTLSGSNINCAIALAVPNGPLNYSVKTLDANNAVLSQVSGTATISGKTSVPLALQGVWKSVDARLANEHPQMGAASTIAVKVMAFDADGALIVGPEPYTSPIPVTDTDTTGATSLSKTSVTSPGDSLTLSYDGHSYVNPTIIPGDPNATLIGQQDIMTPAVRITEYAIQSGSISANNAGHARMIVNADNSISFIEQNQFVGRVTMAGTITETRLPLYYYDLIKGADGNLWALAQSCGSSCGSSPDNNTLERINSDGSVSALPDLPNYTYGNVTVGSDGNFWAVTSINSGSTPIIERITPAGVVTTFSAGSAQSLGDSVLGSDGNIWYAASKNYQGEFLKVTPSGQVTEYALPSADVGCCNNLGNVAAGPDGQIYSLLGQQLLERISTSGAVSHISDGFLPQMGFYGQSTNTAIGFGPDGALWASGPGTAYCEPEVERITTTGTYAVLELPISCDNMSGPAPPVTSFVSGPDGNLWYTRDKFVGKVTLH